MELLLCCPAGAWFGTPPCGPAGPDGPPPIALFAMSFMACMVLCCQLGRGSWGGREVAASLTVSEQRDCSASFETQRYLSTLRAQMRLTDLMRRTNYSDRMLGW